MAIKPYEVKGEIQYHVYVNVRSPVDPSIRIQRRLRSVKTEREAKREELRLIKECERELASLESKGSSWGRVIETWDGYLSKTSLTDTTKLDYVAALKKHTNDWWEKPACDSMSSATLISFWISSLDKENPLGFMLKLPCL
jgi:hypothetical protein